MWKNLVLLLSLSVICVYSSAYAADRSMRRLDFEKLKTLIASGNADSSLYEVYAVYGGNINPSGIWNGYSNFCITGAENPGEVIVAYCPTDSKTYKYLNSLDSGQALNFIGHVARIAGNLDWCFVVTGVKGLADDTPVRKSGADKKKKNDAVTHASPKKK